MKRLVYYNPILVTHADNLRLPGMAKFSSLFKVFGPHIIFLDRTDTIRLPVRTRALLPMPQYRHFIKTYADICHERALELLNSAERAKVRMYVFWSGGIDSTTVLSALLQNATSTQKANMTVLLSEESITENPNFYRDHIRGNLLCDSSMKFPYVLGGDHLIVNGEHNDQLFGGDLGLNLRFGNEVMQKPYDPEVFRTYFSEKTEDPFLGDFHVDLLERLRSIAPIRISSNFDVFWWYSFCLKWQSVYTRTLAYTTPRNAHAITPAYLAGRYRPFFNTENFQLWSMNNLDKKIRDDWRSYKWPAKEFIYDFTKDAEYRDTKVKRNSLFRLMMQQTPFNFIDESLHLYQDLDTKEYFEPENDFR